MIEVVLGFIIGWLVAIAYLSVAVKDAIDKLSKTVEPTSKEIPTFFIEEHNSVLYAWDSTNTFVSQANTIDALVEDFSTRLNIKRAVLVTATKLLFVSSGSICAERERKTEE